MGHCDRPKTTVAELKISELVAWGIWDTFRDESISLFLYRTAAPNAGKLLQLFWPECCRRWLSESEFARLFANCVAEWVRINWRCPLGASPRSGA